MTFINTGKNRGFFQKRDCNYGRLLSDFFGSSCAPGAHDFGHDPNVTNAESLCSLCRTNILQSVPVASIPIEDPLAKGMNVYSRNICNIFYSSYFHISEGGSEGGDGEVAAAEEQPAEDIVEGVVNDEPAPAVIPDERNFKINCNADATNRFYGNLGALRCLSEEGDVAVLELQYLRRTLLFVNIHIMQIKQFATSFR